MRIAHPTWPMARLCLGVALPLLLAACGGGDDEPTDPMRAFNEQKLVWESCGSSTMAYVAGAQCTTVKVPLNYAQPEQETLEIQVARVPARGSSRKGTLLVNPGGPGADGSPNGLHLFSGILNAPSNDNNVTALQNQLLAGYDLVGFTPRGVTGQYEHQCDAEVTGVWADHSTTGYARPGNLDYLTNAYRNFSAACRSNPRTPYINTDATARDMDLIRQVLGEEKISYLGYSYGTWLGAWYASLFPERVDRMVLDSNADFSSAYMDATNTQPLARQRLVDDFLAAYAARHPSTFNLGNSAQEARTTVANLDAMVRAALRKALAKSTYQNRFTHSMLNTIAAGKGLNTLLQSQPGATIEELRQALQTFVFLPQNTQEANDDVRVQADALLDNYQSALDERARMGESYKSHLHFGYNKSNDSSFAVLLSVTCNDATLPSTNLDYWYAISNDWITRAPVFSGDVPLLTTCTDWGGPTVSRPALSAMPAAKILMVQSQYDGATAAEGAMKAFAAVPGMKMVYVENEYQHGVFPYSTPCVDAQVLAHFLGSTGTPGITTCAPSGVAVPLDNPATKSAESDPQALARAELIRQFKDLVGR